MQEKNDGQNKQGGLSWSTPQNQAQKAPQQQKPATTQSGSSMKPKEGSSVAKYAGMVVVGVIAGVMLAWGWVSLRPGSDADTNATSTPSGNQSGTSTVGGGLGIGTTTLPGGGSDPALTILTPQSAGTSVTITKAIVSSPTWIVVYENNAGKPGNALGAALFFPEKQSGTVELLRATTPGKTYLAAKQVDNGDRRFSLKDDQFVSEGGAVQWVTFETK